jgi:undecaprenol kinase/diacylglycerol kinase (ATP)
MKFSFKKFLDSIYYSLEGIIYSFSQQSFFLMFLIAIGTLIFSFWLQISYFEWLIVIFLIGFILSLEMLNTVFERTLDFLEPYISDKIKMIKDLIAGTVFIACLTTIILGIIIFLPKILFKF